MKSKTSKPNPDHIAFDAAGNAVYCQHCDAKISYTLPIELGLFVALLKGFIKAHRDCRPNQQKETPTHD